MATNNISPPIIKKTVLVILEEQAYVIPKQNSIEELYNAYQDQEGHECIEEECPSGCVVEVFVPDVEGDILGGGF